MPELVADLRVDRSPRQPPLTAGFIVGVAGECRSVFETQRTFIEASGIGIAMIGLLQALPRTQRSRRLEAEGRLLTAVAVSGNQTSTGSLSSCAAI